MDNDLTRLPVTGSRLAAGFREAGLQAGDTVFVHALLSAFGQVTGGASTIIGPPGTLVMPAFTWNQNHAADRVVFDMQRDGVKDEVGIIAETFRRRIGVRRSRHVCHTVTLHYEQTQKETG